MGDRSFLLKSVQVMAGERQIAAGGAGRMETFYPRGFRYLQLAVTGHNGPVRIGRIGAMSQVYPHPDSGSFECSDEALTRIWWAGERTLRVCSEDVFVDCPWRERTLYAGDMLAEIASAYVVGGDTKLGKRCVELFLQSQDPETRWQSSRVPTERCGGLFDYPLLTLLSSEWLQRLTADATYAAHCLPYFREMVDRALESLQPNGLIASFTPPFIDHHTNWDGLCIPLNALFARALQAYGRLATLAGQPEETQRVAPIAAAMLKAVQTLAWSEARGAFTDYLLEGEQSGTYYGVTSAWCSFFGLTSPHQEERLLAYYEELLGQTDQNPDLPVSAYAAFFLLGGLYQHDHEEFAERFIRNRYLPMLEAGSDTIWEMFAPNNSLAHAWSTAPTYYLSTRMLGVRLGMPEAEDFDGITIAPQAANISWAQGAVPHPRGLVEVRWRVDGAHLKLAYRAPKGVPVEVKPQGRLAHLALTVETW